MISVALHLDDENSQSVRLFMNQHTLPQRFRISYVKDNSGHYPINRLRNVAINNTLTSHFWLTDIDIWPACSDCKSLSSVADLYETLLSLPASLLSEDRQALIVPAYEVSYNSKQLKIVDKSKGINRNRDGVCTDLEGCFFKWVKREGVIHQTSLHGSPPQGGAAVLLGVRSVRHFQEAAAHPRDHRDAQSFLVVDGLRALGAEFEPFGVRLRSGVLQERGLRAVRRGEAQSSSAYPLHLAKLLPS